MWSMCPAALAHGMVLLKNNGRLKGQARRGGVTYGRHATF